MVSVFLDIFRRPTILEVLGELVLFIAPLWVAVFVGVLVGWAWKPKWASMAGREVSDCSESKKDASSSSSSPQISSTLPLIGSIPSLNSMRLQLPTYISWISDDGVQQQNVASLPPPLNSSEFRSVLKLLKLPRLLG